MMALSDVRSLHRVGSPTTPPAAKVARGEPLVNETLNIDRLPGMATSDYLNRPLRTYDEAKAACDKRAVDRLRAKWDAAARREREAIEQWIK